MVNLRRAALTNMIEAGCSGKEAMEVSGHKTPAVFDRYHILSTRRLKELTPKMEAYLKHGKRKARRNKVGRRSIERLLTVSVGSTRAMEIVLSCGDFKYMLA